MQTDRHPQYGLWLLVLVNLAIFVGFSVSFLRPRTRTDWRTLGAFSAFLLALFTEMYGFPLTLYLLWSWFGSRFPALDPLSHESGHLWLALLGYRGDPHLSFVHLLSNFLIFGGFALIGSGWQALYRARSRGVLATTGPYRWVRHPQYLGFIVVMVGFVLQWPTFATLAMFPVLVLMCVRLARREEQAVRETFGESYDRYAACTPAFLPMPWRARTRRASSWLDA